MSNKWGIPKDVESFVLKRDTHCVYCGIKFDSESTSRKTKPSWEHIVNDIRINNSDNIALCCISCNASKGAKPLKVWLDSKYCSLKNITSETVAEVVKVALNNPPSLVMDYEEICQEYTTWFIQLTSKDLNKPIFFIWLTDSLDEQDKFVINEQNKIISSENINVLIKEAFKYESILPDPAKTLEWLENVQGIQCSATNIALELIEQSILSKSFNKTSISEAVNFINLYDDFVEQTGDQEPLDSPNIRLLWNYYYDDIFWIEYSSGKVLGPQEIPEFEINPTQLSDELSDLIESFFRKIEIIKE